MIAPRSQPHSISDDELHSGPAKPFRMPR